jgi:ribosomal protein L37AE/L43A
MAGRLVILEFDDSLSADSFVENTNMASHLAYRVLGLYVKPETYCQCPDKRRQTVKNWARGKKTGLWLCKTCKKPSAFYSRGLMVRLREALGYNQLEAE